MQAEKASLSSKAKTNAALPTAAYETTLWDNRKCYLVCILISMAPFQFGFDNTIMAGFQAQPAFLRHYGYTTASGQLAIGTIFQQLLASMGYVGQVLMALLFGWASKWIGRKNSIRIACVLGIVSFLMQMFAKNEATIIIARVIVGGSNVVNDMLAIIWAAETAPPHLRGTMGQLFQPFIGLGVLLGAGVSNVYKSSERKIDYQIQLAYLLILPTFTIIVTFFLPETPRWLVVRGRIEEGKSSLRWFRGNGPSALFVEEEIEQIILTVQREEEQGQANLRDIFRGTDLRRTMLSIAVSVIMACSGAPFISAYSTYFFKATGVKDPFLATLLSKGVAGSIGGIIGLYLTIRIPRKTMMVTAFTITSAMMLMMAVAYTAAPTASSTSSVIIVAVSLFNAAYYAGVAPTAWVSASEIPNNRLRSRTWSFGMATCNLVNWSIAFTAPYFINSANLNWGAKYGFIWCGSSIVAVLFIIFCVPETANRSLEEIDELFESGISVRKFKGYKTEGLKRREVRELGSPDQEKGLDGVMHEHVGKV